MDCIFCKIANKEVASKILYEDDLVTVILDANPVSDGHTLVIPKKHYTDYTELDSDILEHIFRVAQNMGFKLMDKLDAMALTLLINYGDAQQVKHFHLHVIPDFLGAKESTNLKDPQEIYDILKD